MYFVSDQHLLAKENENNIGANFAYKKTFHTTTIMFMTHPKCESRLKAFLKTQRGSDWLLDEAWFDGRWTIDSLAYPRWILNTYYRFLHMTRIIRTSFSLNWKKAWESCSQHLLLINQGKLRSAVLKNIIFLNKSMNDLKFMSHKSQRDLFLWLCRSHFPPICCQVSQCFW